MAMNRCLYTYRFKLAPNRQQAILLAKHCGAARYIYNYFLAARTDYYRQNDRGLNFYDNCSTLTVMKGEDSTGWLREINAQSLQAVLRDLDSAFNGFFSKKKRYPRFHSKYKKNSFRSPQYTRVEEGRLIMRKFKEGIRMIQDRPVEGKIKFATVSKESTGEYFVAITVEREIKELPEVKTITGIDLGVKDLIVCSDKKVYSNNRYTYKYEFKLKKKQRVLSRRVKGSNNRNKARIQVAKVHKKIKNSRLDVIHKATTDIVRNNDIIVMESLRPVNMVKNRKLAKAISDSSFGEIKRQLEYKSKWYGRVLVNIDTFYPSSKTCSNCNFINRELSLGDRTWVCTQCAMEHDRDYNASVNILNEGLRNIASGIGVYACGANVRLESLSVFKQMVLKQEILTNNKMIHDIY